MVDIRKINPEEVGPDPRDTEVAELRAELKGLTMLVRNVLSERDTAPVQGPPPEPPRLEPSENERERILAAWAAEPKVAIFIAPDDNDKRIRDDQIARGISAEFPPRVFQVNGVQLAVPVGQSATVPESIAALHEYMLNPWKSQFKLPPLTFEQMEAQLARAGR